MLPTKAWSATEIDGRSSFRIFFIVSPDPDPYPTYAYDEPTFYRARALASRPKMPSHQNHAQSMLTYSTRAVSSAVRASGLHPEGPAFKSLTAHQSTPLENRLLDEFCGDKNVATLRDMLVRITTMLCVVPTRFRMGKKPRRAEHGSEAWHVARKAFSGAVCRER